jgi:WD40 repeat protein
LERERAKAERVKQIYECIIEEDPAKWDSLVDALCQDEPEVREEVADLLQLTPRVVDFIEKPIVQDPLLRTLLQEPIDLGRRIGPYELVEEVGRGGTGVVFRARRADAEYQSEVAIKLVWPGFNREEVLQRFRQERQILAKLQHPHIARLLDGGTTEEGWPYIVMEFVEGDPLTVWAERHRAPLEQRIRLFVQVCDAVAYAHRQQIVHRDLKPGNIFVTHRADGESEEIRLLDFGIARILDTAGQMENLSLTKTGLQAMTPEYASPEQVREEEVTEASDLYSLGVVLYELLAGVHPLRLGSTPRTLSSVLRAVTDEEPPLPSRADRSDPSPLRGDLDSIIRRAMRKDPADRYRSVLDLRNDLLRYLDGQPVEARRGNRGYRLRKWLVRHKALAGTAALSGLLLAGSLTGLGWWRGREARKAARQAWQAGYPQRLEQAAVALREGDAGTADRRLREDLSILARGEADLRGFEWGLLWRRVHGEHLAFDFPGRIGNLTFTSGQSRLSVVSYDRPDASEALAPGSYGWLAVRLNLLTGSVERQLEIDPKHRQTWLAWVKTDKSTPPSLLLGATVDRAMRLWDFDSGREVPIPPLSTSRRSASNDKDWLSPLVLPQQLEGVRSGGLRQTTGNIVLVGRAEPTGDPVSVSLSGDLQWVASKTAPREIRIWEWETGRQLGRLPHPSEITFYCLDPDSRWLAVGGAGGDIIVWDVGTMRERWRLPTRGSRVISGLILPAPARLVLGRENGQLEIFDLPSGRLLRQIDAHTDWINTISWLPKRGIVITASHDQTLRLWDADSFALRRTIAGYQGEVYSAIPDFGEQTLATIGGRERRTLKVWNLDQMVLPDRLGDESTPIFDVAISRDQRRIAAVSGDGRIRLWDQASGRLRWERRPGAGQLFAVAFSPAGDLVAASGEGREVYLWESASGTLHEILEGHTGQIHGLAFSPEGRWLASASDDRTVRLWDPRSGQLRHRLTGAAQDLHSVTFRPDGRELATGSADGKIYLWSLPEGRDQPSLRRQIDAHRGWVWSLQYARDGQSLLSGSGDWTAAVWNLATGERTVHFEGHYDEVFAASFSSDGKRVATASNDKTVQIWDTRSGQSLLTLREHRNQVWGLAFSPDGTLLATGGWDGQILLHRALPEEEVHIRLEQSARLQRALESTPLAPTMPRR